MASSSVDVLKVRCGCGAKLGLPPEAAGRAAKCPKCGKAFRVPARDEVRRHAPQPIDSSALAGFAPSDSPERVSQPAKRIAPTSASATSERAGSGRLSVTCGECGTRFAARDTSIGKRAKCGKCGVLFEVPAPRDPADEPMSADDILGFSDDAAGRGDFDDGALAGLAGGTAIERTPEPDASSGSVAGGMSQVRRGPAAEPAILGAAKCPSCERQLAPGSKICRDCRINIHTGKSILARQESHLDAAYVKTESSLWAISWIVGCPIMPIPIASEAYGKYQPWSIRAIVAVTVVVSFLWWFLPSLDGVAGANMMLWGGNFNSEAGEEAQALGVGFRMHQLLTHQLLHNDIFHLVGNILFIWVLGARVNRLVGNLWTVALYPLMGVCAAFLQMLTTGSEPPYPMLGASGAMMGLAGMYLVLFPVHKVHVAWWIRIWFRAFWSVIWPVRGFWVVIWAIGFDIAMIALGSQDNVAHWAHVGGFLSGVAIAVALLMTKQVNAIGGDIFTALLGKRAWAIVGKPRGLE